MCDFDIYTLRSRCELFDLLELVYYVLAEPVRNFGVPTKAKTWETFVVDLSKVDLTETFDVDALKSSDISLVIGQAAAPRPG